jgi:choline-sulfatase
MRAGRIIVVAIFVAAVGVAVAGHLLRRSMARRTVVLVTLDTLRADRVGRTPSITPELDKLAARGVVFERAWTTAPITVPAHATLLTGLLPPRHGLRLNQPPAPLPAKKDRPFETMAEILGAQGFATGAFVSASVLRADDTGFAAGFDVYDEVPRAAPGALHDSERRGEETVAKALQWAKEQGGAVFLWVHFFDPHSPYDAPVGWGAGPTHVADAQGYDAEVAYVDHCVGTLLAGLADAGRGDATVCVVADHGESLGEHGEPTHGYLLHEATLHVPLVFASPGLSPGRRAAPVSTVDVFPTLLSFANAPIPPQVMGAPLFEKGRPDVADRPIYAESLYGRHASGWAQTFALRRGDVKLVASGPRQMKFDLSKDAAEERPAAFDAADKDALAQMMDVARRPALGVATPGGSGAPLVDYVGGGGGPATVVIADDENAKVPSPYDRMDVLAKFDRACALVGVGRAIDALTAFDEILAVDPGNIQTAYWRARALESKTLGRDREAAVWYRRAFDMGFRSPKCVAKALYCSLNEMSRADASPARRAEESDTALAFLADARAKGLRDDSDTYVMEAALRLERGELDLSEAALRRAEKLPHDERGQDRIDRCKARLSQARKGG